MERNNVYRIGMMRRTARLFFHYVYYNPRMVCRIMAAVNGVFFMVISIILVINLLCATYFKRQSPSTSEPSKYNLILDFDLPMPIGMEYTNESKLTIKWVYSLIFTTSMLFINVRLLMATFNRNIYSIVIWLVVHTTHMLYSLSTNLYVGISKGYSTIIYLTIFNTFLYLLFISLVGLFWMEERYCIRVPICTNDNVATIQEGIA